MRKYIQILSALLVLAAVSCEKGTDGPGGSGTGNQEIRFPSGNSYHTGEDVIIICSGISSGASFWLVSADGTQTPLEDVTVTDSGIFFTPETAGARIPASSSLRKQPENLPSWQSRTAKESNWAG